MKNNIVPTTTTTNENTPVKTAKKTVNFCAAIPTQSELNNKLAKLKETFKLDNNAKVLEHLVNFFEKPFRSEPTTRQTIERFIQNELLCPTQKLNTHTVKKFMELEHNVQPLRPLTNEVLALYQSEIDTHNAQFEQTK